MSIDQWKKWTNAAARRGARRSILEPKADGFRPDRCEAGALSALLSRDLRGASSQRFGWGRGDEVGRGSFFPMSALAGGAGFLEGSGRPQVKARVAQR